MISKIVVTCYRIIPTSLKNKIGSMAILKPIRDMLLRENNHYKETCGTINRVYRNREVAFHFFASLQDVARAQKKGVETSTLINSIALCERFKSNRENLMVFDIGANFGFLSLVWAKTICKDKGKVVAFEPNRYVFESFEKSINKNNLGTTITLEHSAVGSENKMVELFLNNTTSNVLKSEVSMDSVSTSMVTIDTYMDTNNINRCDIIKIDVDGIELDILKGSIKTIEDFKPIFIVETNNNLEIINFFKEKNYKVLDMALKVYVSGSVLPPNIFCVPN